VAGLTYSEDFPSTPGAYDEEYHGLGDAFVAQLDTTGSDLLWCTFLGGEQTEDVIAMAINQSGDLVLSGQTTSPDFPSTAGAFDESHNGEHDVYVAMLDASGSVLHWSTFLGGSAFEMPYLSVVLDTGGNPIVEGYTASKDFPTTPGAFDRSHNGPPYDAFVTKLDASGSCLLWSTFLGGTDTDFAHCLTIDADNNPIVAGLTVSADFPTTSGAHDETHSGQANAFVTKLSATGSSVLWSTFLGGESYDSYDQAYTIAIDSSGNPIVGGMTWSDDFPITPYAYDTSHNGNQDIFVSKLDASGSELLWSTFLGGEWEDYCHDMVLDRNGSPILVGWTTSTDYPTTPGAYREENWDIREAIISKLGPLGRNLAWSSYIGGNARDVAWGVVLDDQERIVLTGQTTEAGNFDFPTTHGAYDQTHNGEDDVFLAKLELLTGTGVASPGGTQTQSRLQQSFPNPFNPAAEIRFRLAKSARVSLRIFDPSGRLLRNLLRDAPHHAGPHRVSWDGRDKDGNALPSGVYLCRLEAGQHTESISMTLLR